jgi:hypothetical protein
MLQLRGEANHSMFLMRLSLGFYEKYARVARCPTRRIEKKQLVSAERLSESDCEISVRVRFEHESEKFWVQHSSTG